MDKESKSESRASSEEKDPIRINPAHRGDFTAWAKRHGFKSVQAAAAYVMANKADYAPQVVRMANFAHNAPKFSHPNEKPMRAMFGA